MHRVHSFDTKNLIAEESKIFRAYIEQAQKNFMCFARGLTIAAQHGAQLFENVMADFQRNDLEDIAPSLEAVRDGRMPIRPRWWFERTKKASKDADLAVMIMWLIAFPTRPFYAQVGAGDRDQAAIVKDRIVHLLHHNPWLNDYVEIVQWHVKSKKEMAAGQPMAKLDIMAADIGGAHGGTPDLLVINELTHVVKWEFIQNLMDNADGVAQGVAIVATNAGHKGSEAEAWRKNAIKSDRWEVRIWDKPAPWHNAAAIKDAKDRESSKSRFNRLWYGKWSSGEGDVIDEEVLNEAFSGNLSELMEPKKGYIYLAGLDIGIQHDHSGLVVLGVNARERSIELAYMRGWAPPGEGREVNLMAVEDEIRRVDRTLHIRKLLYDPSQAKLMAQRLESSISCEELYFTAANCTAMVESLIQALNTRQLHLYDIEGGRLRRDLSRMKIVEKQWGYKLEAVRDSSGHCDVATALIIVLPTAIAYLEGHLELDDDMILMATETEDLTEDELEDMPDALRGIYDMGADDELEALYKKGAD